MALNAELQRKLKAEFKPRGIVAYSNCCHAGCTRAYDETDKDFQRRPENGIYFIQLFLNGMNYNPCPQSCCVIYRSFEYVMAHWHQECALLHKWCEVVGLGLKEYIIRRPWDESQHIEIVFFKPIKLDPKTEEASAAAFKEVKVKKEKGAKVKTTTGCKRATSAHSEAGAEAGAAAEVRRSTGEEVAADDIEEDEPVKKRRKR